MGTSGVLSLGGSGKGLGRLRFPVGELKRLTVDAGEHGVHAVVVASLCGPVGLASRPRKASLAPGKFLGTWLAVSWLSVTIGPVGKARCVVLSESPAWPISYAFVRCFRK